MDTKTSKIGISAAYLYLLLPFTIFVIGWFKIWFAIPICIVLVISYKKMLQDAPALWRPDFTKENIFKIVVILFIILTWVSMSGIGTLVWQNGDHYYRNRIFQMIVEYDWPVINTDMDRGMIYYIGFWMPSAIVGKLFGVQIGNVSQVLWAALGVILVYYFICARSKKLEILPIIVMVFFGGLDYVGSYLTGANMNEVCGTLHLEWWGAPYQFSSMTTQLFWVYNQAIPAWLVTAMLFNMKNCRSMVIVISTLLLTSTFPFIGVLPIVLGIVIIRIDRTHPTWKKDIIKELFTFQNVVGGGCIGILSFLYLVGNRAGDMVNETTVRFEDKFVIYLVFIILEAGIYLVLIYPKHRDNVLYYIIAVVLVICPLFRIGSGADFGMRTTIPALFVLMMYVIDEVRDIPNSQNKLTSICLIVFLIIGSRSAINEMARTCSNTASQTRSEYIFSVDEGSIWDGINFTGDLEDNWFFDVFLK